MESVTHAGLKTMALAWLRGCGCRAVGLEVRCPIGRFRVDAAGYLDRKPGKHGSMRRAEAARRAGMDVVECGPGRGERGRTIILESKQSRADFLSDRGDGDRLRRELERLMREKHELEELIVKACEPELRRLGSSLFNELDEWDFSSSRVVSYRRLVEKIALTSGRLHGSRKFWLLAHYRLADALYIAAPAGMIQIDELPAGWGLLEISRHAAQAAVGAAERAESIEDVLRETKAGPLLTGRWLHRRVLLHNIAAAAARDAYGVSEGDRGR